MRRGRLPLTALRSFEAAGRHLSFTLAADELAVSQAAISRQVRELERLVGIELFCRGHRSVALTEAGARLLSRVTDGFDTISAGLEELRAERPASVVRVSSEPAFGGTWLMLHLEEFRCLRPDVDVIVDPNYQLAEFRGGNLDLAIRWSRSTRAWPRVASRHLADCRNIAVMAPSVAASVASVQDLAEVTLLHEESRDYWSEWFAAVGIERAPTVRGPILPGAYAIEAARLGQGVALSDPLWASADLASGALVQPFSDSVPYGAYWLVAPNFDKLTEPARAFVEWLVRKVRAETSDAREDSGEHVC